MDMNSFNTFFDIIEMLAGAYIIYQGINMKRTGKVEGSGLVSKNIHISSDADVPGFIKMMFPMYMVSGGLFILAGLFTTYYDKQPNQNTTISLAVTLALVAICAALAFFTNRAQKKYLM